MNKQEALRRLAELLGSFSISLHPAVLDEIMSIITNSGCESRVFATLSKRLFFLSEYGNQAQFYHEEFEHLGRGIYSMHVAVASLNIRVLYAFRDPDTILLLAFYERGGKKKTDYTSKIKEAEKRLDELK